MQVKLFPKDLFLFNWKFLTELNQIFNCWITDHLEFIGCLLSTHLPFLIENCMIIWVKVFKNGPSKTCGRQPLKNMKRCGLLRQTISLQIFQRLSSANFAWSILEYFYPYVRYRGKYGHLFSYHVPMFDSSQYLTHLQNQQLLRSLETIRTEWNMISQ